MYSCQPENVDVVLNKLGSVPGGGGDSTNIWVEVSRGLFVGQNPQFYYPV